MAQFTAVAPAITTSGTTWAQLKTGGVELLLNNLVTANPALANPTVQATAASSVATGGLTAGTYYVSYSFVDAYGETLTGGESAQFTASGLTQLWTVTLPALPTYAKQINLYVTNANGASGTETLYATGITTTTFAMLPAQPTDQSTESAPSVNDTGAASHIYRLYALCTRSSTELIHERLVEDVSNLLSGYPIQLREVFRGPNSWWGIMATWTQVLKEVHTLVVANYPNATLSTGVTGIGFPVRGWTLP
jgi:hypothetical protein